MAKTVIMSDFHAPLEAIQRYAEHDVQMVINMRKAWHEQSLYHDLFNFLSLLGIKSAPKGYRTPIIDSISSEEHSIVLIGDINEQKVP